MLKRAVLLALLFGAPAAVRATVIAPADFRDIVGSADIIAYGRVLETAVGSSEDRKRVYTIVTMQVGTYLKGGPGETLAFQVPGGRIGRYQNVLVGAPRFAAGEEAIVFLDARADGLPVVVGLNQGVFRVRLDRRTQRRIVTPGAFMASGGAPERLVRGARPAVALETFGAQVQSVLAGAGAER